MLAGEAARGGLLFVSDANYPPITYLDRDVPKGVAVDLVRALSTRMNRPIEIRLMAWQEAQNMVLQGKADALFPMSITEARQQSFDFSHPLLELQFSIFTRSTRSGINGVEDLNGLRVGVTSGGLPRQLLQNNPAIKLIIIDDYPQGFQLLTDGGIDAVAADRWVGTFVVAEKGFRDVQISGEPIARLTSALAVKKGEPTVLPLVNEALKSMEADGTIERITKNWEPKQVVFLTREQMKRWGIGFAFGILLLLLTLMFFWMISLRREIAVRRRAENQIVALHQRLSFATRSAGIGIWDWDVARNILVWDDEMHRIYKISKKDFFGAYEVWSKALHPADRERAQAEVQGALRDEKPFDTEFRIVWPDGTVRTIRASAQSFRGADGRPLRMVGVNLDVTPHTQAEEQLRFSEERFRSALQNSPIGMALVAPDGRWLEVNPMLCGIVGYSREEMLSRDFQSITHPDDLAADRVHLGQMLARETDACQIEKRYVHKSGRIVWIQLNASLICNPDGAARHFVCQIQDITARKKAETERLRLVRALRERVKELTALHETARLLQQERPVDQDFLAEWVALLPPAWQYPEICEARVAYNGLTAATPGWRETPWKQSVSFTTGDGQSGVIEVVYLDECPSASEGPFMAEERTLIQSLSDMLAAHLDHKRAEHALRDVNERYLRHEAAITALTRSYAFEPENLPILLKEIAEVVARTLEVERVGIWTYNSDRTAMVSLELFEKGANRHYPSTEIFRTGHESYFNAVDSADVIAAHNAWEDNRTASLVEGYLAPREITSILNVPLHARGITMGVLGCEHIGLRRTWASDEQTFAVAVANLLSMLFAQLEQQQLESQLRQTQKLEALGTLAGGIAHDFNNILGAIISFTELSKMDNPHNAELQENLQQVLKASNRATNLVRQILSFSRQQKQERRPTQLAPVFKEALKLLRSTLPSTIEIEQRIAAGLPEVLADPTQMHQVTMNLCTNAAQAMQNDQGRLVVELDSFQLSDGAPNPHPDLIPGSYLRLTVSDTGHGMDQAVLHRIFEPFFTTKKPGEGTGLGLAVVHGIVKDHDGVIIAASQPGQGTTFTIYLPAIGPAAEPEFEPLADVPRGRGERILFVDDEAALCDVAQRVMTRLGYEPIVFRESAEAWKALHDAPGQFAAVVSDLTMPGMTGLELARRILTLRPSTPVILTSGFSGGLTDETVRELGIQALIHKPLDYKALAIAVDTALHRAKSSRQN